jgi:hypothetical protein
MMSVTDMSKEKDLGFKVSDRRMFNPDGTLREPIEPDEAATAQSHPPSGKVVSFPGEATSSRGAARQEAASDSVGKQVYERASQSSRAVLPEASFTGLINMLAVEAAMHLGLIESPAGERAVDLEAARHLIDMLGILQEKTRGNLTRDEDLLLEDILADLRMQFVAASRKR